MVATVPMKSGNTAHPLQADVEAFIESLLNESTSSSFPGQRDAPPMVASDVPSGGDVKSPPVSTSPTSHFIVASSATPNFLHALSHPPPSAPAGSAPIAFLHRAPTSTLQASLSPGTLLLSNHSAITCHLSIGYNLPLASDFGISTASVLPLLDPSPHRAHQAVGLVGTIDPAEAAGYRFQTPQLRFRLLEMAGPNAPVVNRVSDVMQLCVGVSEEGAIGVFDYSRQGGDGGTRGMGDRDSLEEEDEDEEEGAARPAIEALPETPPSNEGTTLQNGTLAPTVTAIAISRNLDGQTVDQAHSVARKAGYLNDSNATLLFVTAQPRQAGLDAARKHKMLVMCVTSVAASWWALRYIGRKVQETWPDLEVREVRK